MGLRKILSPAFLGEYKVNIKIILLFSFLFYFNKNNILANDYPSSSSQIDQSVNILIESGNLPFILEGGDTVGWTTTTSSFSNGLCWFPSGIDLHNGSVVGVIDFATPLGLSKSLSFADDRYLYLRSDLILNGRIDLLTSGKINGGASRVILNGPLYLNGNYINGVDFPLHFVGNGNTIFFNNDGAIRPVGTALGVLNFENVILDSIHDGSINKFDVDFNLILESAIVKLDGNYCFSSSKSLDIHGDVLITGTHTFCLDAPCNIYDNSQLIFDLGTTFSMGTSGTITMVGNRTGSIYFNGSTIQIGTKDFEIDYGKIIFGNEITIDDNGKHKAFICGTNSLVDVIGSGRVVLENTTTFSAL